MWGARGLDSIISGLLESMSDRGPPPAKKDKVDAIPVVDATQETVNESKWTTVGILTPIRFWDFTVEHSIIIIEYCNIIYTWHLNNAHPIVCSAGV